MKSSLLALPRDLEDVTEAVHSFGRLIRLQRLVQYLCPKMTPAANILYT